MAVFVTIGLTDRELLIIKQDKCGCHVIWLEMDIYLCGDELHGDIIADTINRNCGVLTDFSGNPVVKTVIQPLSGLWFARMCFGGFITVKRYIIDSTMERGVVRTYVVSQKPIKLSQRADCSYVQGIKPAFFQSTEMALYLALVM